MNRQASNNNDWLRLVVEQMPAVLWATDMKLRFTFCNAAGLAMKGLDPNTLDRVGLFEHFKTEDPYFPPIAAHRRALRGESVSYEHEWGSRFFRCYLQPLRDHNSKTIGCIGVAWDISQLHQSEAQLREEASRYHTLLEWIPAITYIAEVDEVSGTICVTPQIECLGFPRNQWTVDRTLWIRQLHPEDRDYVLRNLHHCHHTGDTFRLDYRMLAMNGDIHWFRDEARLAKKPDGHQFIYGVMLDITDRKRAEEAIRTEQRTLERMVKSQDQERQLIAYEIHDGLAQQLSAAIMQFQAFSQLQSHDREQASRTLEAGLQLLRDSLSEARRLIDGLRPVTLDESGIVAAIGHLVRELRNQGDLEIEFHSNVASERLEPLLENTVFRIVQEGLTNARRHSRSDRLLIEVVKQVDTVRVEIRDWGIGFDPENVKGDHFGLEGMRERARLLGGRTVVSSAPGRGTRISVILPLTVEA